MENLLVGVAIAGLVALVALVARSRQRTDAPTQRQYRVPVQIDRADFGSPEQEWLIVVFTAATCSVCADVAAKADALVSRNVFTKIVDYAIERDTHVRYGIDAVPTLIIADSRGVVRHHELGPVTATDLWAAVARVRDGVDPDARTCNDH